MNMSPNPPGVMEKNNKLMMKMDRKREKGRVAMENKSKSDVALSQAKKINKTTIGERVMPGHKRRKTEITHTKDAGGTVVSYKPTNYLRK